MSLSSINGADGDDYTGQDIDELLDPDVFELPPVGPSPSLEEILKEDDSTVELDLSDVLDENQLTNSNNFDDSSEVTSIATSSSFSRDLNRVDWKKPKRRPAKSQVLRCVKLRGISAQLLSADEKIKSGVPSALAVGTTCVAVGTTHGLVLVFDSKQVLKCCLGNAKNVYECGGVSCLSFTRDCSKLLVAHAKGSLLLYDVKSGRLVRRVDTIHSIGNAILHAVFSDSNSVAIVNDSGGSVYEISFVKHLSSKSSANDCRCIFSGSRGEVCNVVPLVVPDVARSTSRHYTEPLLVAMASMTKVIAVRLRPSTRVVFASPFDGRAQTPPLLAWHFVPMQLSVNQRIIDPVLAFGRDRHLTFYQFHSADGQTFRSVFLQKFEVGAEYLINCAFLNSRCVLAVDDKERAHVYEISSGELMETLNIDNAQLIYSTSVFKGLSTGGNVSKALAFMADNVCYSSLAHNMGSGQVLLLGAKGVFALSVNTWLERVNALTASKDYMSAVTLCLDFFTGAKKLGIAPHNKSDRWKKIIEEKAIEILLEFVDLSVDRLTPTSGKVEVLQDYFKIVVPFCIDACVTLGKEDVLFDRCYSRFSDDPTAKSVFLECLDDYVLENSFENIPPLVCQDFFGYLEREGLFSTIEACVGNLPVTSLDLHQVMTICRTNNLYDGIIYVFNKILQDYLTPLKEMLELLKKVVEQREVLSDEDIRLGNKVLLYISCCLCGRSYPVGFLKTDVAKAVASDTYAIITAMKYDDKCESNGKYEQSYPFLRVLLKFDCREFLNGLGMAFECDFFQTRNGSVKAQRLVDILIRIILNSRDEWNPLQTGALFTFIIRKAVMQSGELLVGRDQFQQILEVVVCGDVETVGTSNFEERQQALIELLQLRESVELIDERMLLSLAEKHKYYQVCETLYWRRRDYEKVLDCYVYDVYRKSEIFAVARSILSNKDILMSEKLATKAKFSHIVQLVAGADIKECAKLLNDYFESSLSNICTTFGDDSELLLHVLKELLETRNSTEKSGFCDMFEINKEVVDVFFRLMCRFDVEHVERMLKLNEPFCTDDVLTICRKNTAVSAVVYLLSRKDEYEEAFKFLSKCLTEAVIVNDCDQISLSVKVAVQFFNSCNFHRSRTACEKMWFEFLDIFLTRQSSTDDLLENEMKKIINEIVQAMINVVDPSILLTKLLDHPAYKNGRYSEIETMVQTILHGYEYEEVLLTKVLDCTRSEIHSKFAGLKNVGARAVVSRLLICSLCKENVVDSGQNRCFVFSCGHCYHVDCLQETKSYQQGRHGVKDWLCIACSQRSARKQPRKSEKTKFIEASERAVPLSSDQKNVNVPQENENLPLKIELLQMIHNTERNPFVESRTKSKFDDNATKLRLGPPRT